MRCNTKCCCALSKNIQATSLYNLQCRIMLRNRCATWCTVLSLVSCAWTSDWMNLTDLLFRCYQPQFSNPKTKKQKEINGRKPYFFSSNLFINPAHWVAKLPLRGNDTWFDVVAVKFVVIFNLLARVKAFGVGNESKRLNMLKLFRPKYIFSLKGQKCLTNECGENEIFHS